MEDESPICAATGIVVPVRQSRAARSSTPAVPHTPPPPPRVTFDRRELDRILGLYGRMVALGEWRDYAIDFTRDKAIFSIFRRASDVPVYRIEKDPRLARKQGAYSVVSQTGLILKRGHELPRVLAVLEKPLRSV
ncbi:DUF2794 domain-containing protein [Xanthobacter sp. TB0139]|uniref:DUF2794 domain-containing protein n=1 Tax=Xanthobacter sp. TB0139 TaxID=3459178 RepID=UPI00403A7598